MIRVSDALEDIISGNALLQLGLQHDLLNLTKLAQFLRPEIEVRTKKEISDSALLMQLSRLRRKEEFQSDASELEIKNMTLYSGLEVLTFDRSDVGSQSLAELHKREADKQKFLTLSQGAQQLTVIVEAREVEQVLACLGAEPRYRNSEVAAIVLSFDERYLAQPGLFNLFCQPLYFQNVNIVELASTATELIIFVGTDDVRLAFDTLFRRFMPKN